MNSIRVFVITGLGDFDAAGNQTLKNTVKYLGEFGYEVHVFSGFPEGFPGLLDPSKLFGPNVHVHRLPRMFLHALKAAKMMKDWIKGKGKQPESGRAVKPSEEIRYYDEYSVAGRAIYVFYLFLFYLPLELARIGLWYLHRKPDLLYGANGQGATVAWALARIYRTPFITRWFGSAIRVEDLESLGNRLLILDGGFALKAPCDALIMNNDGTQGDRVVEALGVPRERVRFWMNGLDLDDFRAPEPFTPEDLRKRLGLEHRRVLLMVARLALWKRQDRGIHCMNHLVHHFGVKDATLVIVGEGPEQPRLEQLRDRLGLADHVTMAGPVPHRNLGPYFRMADVFLTLTDVSNRGNPLYEAMYFGIPVVTISDGSTSDIAVDGVAGFQVPRSRVAEASAERVRQLLGDESLRRSMGANAKKLFDEKVLSWEQRMRLEDDLIRSIMKRRGRGHDMRRM